MLIFKASSPAVTRTSCWTDPICRKLCVESDILFSPGEFDFSTVRSRWLKNSGKDQRSAECSSPNAVDCANDGFRVFVRDHVVAVLDQYLLTPPRKPREAGLQFVQPRVSESVEILISGTLAGSKHHQRKISEIPGRAYLVGAQCWERGVLLKNRRQEIRAQCQSRHLLHVRLGQFGAGYSRRLESVPEPQHAEE